MDILISYDITDTDGAGATRLRRIAEVCEKYGQRVQFSVFECRLSATRMARMIGEVEDAIDHQRDSVIVYRFPGRIDDATLRLGEAKDCASSVSRGCSNAACEPPVILRFDTGHSGIMGLRTVNIACPGLSARRKTVLSSLVARLGYD